jgi:hypothetical protein
LIYTKNSAKVLSLQEVGLLHLSAALVNLCGKDKEKLPVLKSCSFSFWRVLVPDSFVTNPSYFGELLDAATSRIGEALSLFFSPFPKPTHVQVFLFAGLGC